MTPTEPTAGKLISAEWAELGEGVLGLEVIACASCGKVELRVPRPA